MPKCPKCSGLLVEREDGLYQCDGCGKVFKKKAPTTPPVQAVKADASGDCEKSFAAPTVEKPVDKVARDENTERENVSQQEEIAELRARLARLEKETDGGDAVKKQPSAVLTFVKNRGKSVLFVLLILIAFVTLMTCFCGLRGIYVNVDDPDEFFSFSATGYEWYYKLDGEQVLDKGKWSKSGNTLTLKYEDEWFGEVEESYQLKDFSWSSFTLYDSFFEEDKKFERVSVIGYKDSNKKATVTFYSNGGVGGGTHSLKIGSVLSSDETPTREGYLFMGWYTTPDGWKTGEGERYVEEQRVWKDATYYANWKNAAQFTIRGDNLEQPLSFMENDNVENIFRSAMGWNTLPTGVLGVEFFDDEGNKVNSNAAPAANVTARVIYDVTVNNGTLTYVNPALTSYTVPSDVSHIAATAFANSKQLEKLYIAERQSELTVASGAFDACGKLDTVSGYAAKGMRAVVDAFAGIKNLIVSDGVIPTRTFENCSGLLSVTVGSGVTAVGDRAFADCTGLREIVWNTDLSSNLGQNVFANAGNGGAGITVYFGGNATRAFNFFDTTTTSQSPNVTAVVIGDSVTSIGDSAFSGCSSLTSVTIGNRVTSIGSSAFSGCSGLTSITIPDSVTSIGSYAFKDCSGLTSIYYTGDMQSWLGKDWHGEIMSSGRTLYIDSNKLEGAIVIPDGVQSVPSYAFCYQTGIISITIPDSVTSIENYAFSGCSGLTSVTIPDSVTSIGSSAFRGCSGLTSVTIPDSVTSIGSNAFYNCSGLTSITIPDSVTSIGSNAFYGCYKLVEVYNKSNLSIVAGSSGNGYVAYYAKNVYKQESGSKLTTDENGFVFYYDGTTGYLVGYTGSNKKLVLPDGFIAYNGVQVNTYEINRYAFYGCSGLTSVTIPDSVTSIGRSAFRDCINLTSVTIPDSVTSIGEGAFSGCSGLTSVTIPDSVTSIGNSAFSGCYKLVEVCNKSNLSIEAGSSGDGYVAYYAKNVYKQEGGSKLTTDKNGFVFYYDGTTGYLVGYAGDKTKLVLPDGFIAYDGTRVNAYVIYEYAFSYYNSLTSITISDSVTSIGDNAFRGCSGLTSVTIPDSVTSIGESAFAYCSGLTSITIGNGVKTIWDWAFYCSGLTSITIPDSVTSMGDYVFLGCSSLKSVTIGNGVTSIGVGAFDGCRSLTSVTIGNGVTSIRGSAFSDCNSLTSITIPDSVTSIGSYAFDGCRSLKFVTIGNSVTSIGERTFYDCSGLTSVTIGNGVTSIGDDAFYGCSGLTSITIPDSVTSIGYRAFYGCTGLTSAVIGNGVTSIGSRAFYNCSSLTSVTFESTSKWQVSSSSSFVSYTSLWSGSLSNPSTAAIYLKATFGDYYWRRV